MKSISIEIFDPLCETPGCGSRANRSLIVDGVVKSRHCAKHSTPALIAANKAEREKEKKS